MRALRYKRAGWGWRRPRARAIGDSPALGEENVSHDAEAQLASQVGERGDEFALKPLRVEEAGAISGALPHLPAMTWNLDFHFLNPES
jgi:hypothetical protein